MVEATITLSNGKTNLIIATSWSDLSEKLENMPVQKVAAKKIKVSDLRQGKYGKEG